MRSILGEWTGKVRSTPTPNDCFRTVKVSRTPLPWRLITMPSNTWVRRRVPSTTWKCTRTRSPAWKDGTRRSCARSMLSITPDIGTKNATVEPVARGPAMVAKESTSAVREAAGGARGGASLFRAPRAALLEPPFANPGVVARHEHVRNRVPAPLERTRVVGVLRGAPERLAERLLDR